MVYEWANDVSVEEFGLVCHPTIDIFAASPDGIVGKYKRNKKNLTDKVGRMVEIKCPITRKIITQGNIKGDTAMIYYLFEQLQHLDFPGSGLLQYISVRSILASVTAIVLMLCFGGKVIRGLQKLQIGEDAGHYSTVILCIFIKFQSSYFYLASMGR